jgi:hypothetical protein
MLVMSLVYLVFAFVFLLTTRWSDTGEMDSLVGPLFSATVVWEAGGNEV